MKTKETADVEPGYYWARLKTANKNYKNQIAWMRAMCEEQEWDVFLVVDDGGYFTGSDVHFMLEEVEFEGLRLVPPGS